VVEAAAANDAYEARDPDHEQHPRRHNRETQVTRHCQLPRLRTKQERYRPARKKGIAGVRIPQGHGGPETIAPVALQPPLRPRPVCKVRGHCATKGTLPPTARNPPTRSRPRAPQPGHGLPDTLAELYGRHAGQVERWARRLAGPRFDAEDLLHDVFLVVLRRQHEFRDEAKVSTWLFRITAQVVRWRRRNDALHRWLWGTHSRAYIEASPRGPTPVEEYERREDSLRLYAALDRLPEKYRTVLILFAIEENTGDEVADLLGVEVNTVWVRLHRARTKLADLLGKEGPSP
jgi:RNA polymerase sigma-70 factor, ECF subfamily